MAAEAGGGGRRAAFVTPFFADRDAVCNDTYHGARALAARGWETAVFAVGGTSERATVRPFDDLRKFVRGPEDVVCFHFSTGRRDIEEAVAAAPGRKILKFHNITPPEHFAMWSDDLAEASRTGRLEMPRVAAMGWEQVWADSSFNLAEIAPHLPPGTPAGVIAPFHETDELLAQPRPPAAAQGMPRLLTVGRVVQSKGHPFLLRVMRYLVHELGTPAVLDIVGKPDHRLLAYLRMLELMVREFGLERHVRFHGEITAATLAAHYAGATAFVCASEHEGFCVPLVEAMAFGVPVVALGTTAVPETVGGAGIVWDERDPRRFAVTLKRLAGNPAERDWLAAQGRARYAARFSNAMIEPQVVAAIAAGRPAPPGEAPGESSGG